MRDRRRHRRRTSLSGFSVESWRCPLAATLAVALAGAVVLFGTPRPLAAPPSGPALNPVSGNQGFLVFVEGNAALNATGVTGAVALGGDLTMSGTNLALGQSIVASSTSGSLVAANADDGDVNTYWQSGAGFPQTLTVDLGSSRTVNRIVLRLPTAFATRTQTLSVLSSLNGTTYSPVAASASYTFNPATGNQVTITFSSANQRFLRLNITGNTAVSAAQISEFEVYPPSGSHGNNFTVASLTAGTFTAPGDARPTGLLVGGRMNWAASGSNGYIDVRSNGYVKLGNLTGTDISQSAGNPTHLVATGAGYSSRPGVSLMVTQPTASVGQSGLVNFSAAFTTFRSRSSALAACDNTVVLRDSGGTPLPATLPPGTSAYATLTAGTQNILNITASNLNNLGTLTFTNHPNASTPLIINVYTGGVGDDFSWRPPSVNGLNDADSPYIMWNFATATRLTVSGSNPVRGTLYAPRAGVYEQDVSGLYGNVIAQSYAQGGPSGLPSGGEIRNYPFAANIQSCGVPALTITKTANAATTTPGSTVRYDITVTNSGGTSYTGASFTDPLTDVLDDATYNNDASASTGTVGFTSPNLTWTGDLTTGASATISYTVTVASPDTGNHRLLNTVISNTVGSNCASGSGDARCTANVPVADLVITKAAGSPTTTPGSTVNYTVTVTNAGQTTYAGIAVTDNLAGALDDATYNNDASASTGTVSFANPNLTWTGNLAIGATVTITFSMTALPPNVGDNVLVNTVSSTAAGSNCPPGGTDPRCRATVAALVPGLTISKTTDTATTVRGATVGYTMTITNSGQIAYPGATVTDALADVLDDAEYNGDASATAGTVTLSGTNLIWTGDLAVGAPIVTVTYSVTVDPTGADNRRLVNVVTSTAAGSNCPTGSSDPRCTVRVDVAELDVEFTATPATTAPGGVLQFDANFTNTGQVPYFGITLTLPRAGITDDATAVGDQTATSGTLTLTATALLWTGDIPVGGSVTITGHVTVNNPDTGNRLVEGAISTTAPGSNCPPGSTDPRCAIAVPVLVPALTIVKSANTATTVQGGTVDYTVTVTNSGNTPYTGATVADDLSGVLDDATYNADADASAGSLAYTTPTLTWTGDLAIGQVVTITYSVTVNNPDAGDRTLIDKVSSTDPGSTCPPASGAPGCTSVVPVLVPALTITKTTDVAAVTPGGVVAYTVTVANTGQLPYTAATVADDLSGVLDDATYNDDADASAGTVDFTSPNLTWTGDLAVGATVTITYSATVNNPDTGDGQLTNVVTSTEAGNNCPSGGTDPRCTTSLPVESTTTLTFAKSADRQQTAHGQTVSYTITVTNSGLTPYVGATFTDSLAGALDVATYNNDASASIGSLGYTAPALTWTGTVPAGGTATITYTMTVLDAEEPGGDDLLTNNLLSTSAGSNCLSGSTDPRCGTEIPVVHIVIVMSTDPATTATPGSVVRFTATITNNSPLTQYGVVVANDPTDLTDDVTGNGDQTASSGSLTVTPTGSTWTGDLAPQETVTVTGSVTVNDPDTGDRLIRIVAVSSYLGSSCPPGTTNPACIAEVTILVPELTITKAADRPAVQLGGTVNYTVTVTNSGNTPYTDATVVDDLAGVLDDAAYNTDASASSGSVSYTAPNLTWTGDLATGQVVTITFSVTVDNPGGGDHAMVNRVVSVDAGSSCPPASGNAGCTAAVAVLEPRLTIGKTVDVTGTVPGGVVSYTVTITNTGQVPYTGADVADDLSGVLDDATYNGDATASAGTVGFSSPDLTWTGNLAVGATVTITYSATVNNPDTGDGQLTNVVTSTEAGNNCPSGGTDPRCTTSVPVSNMIIVNTVDVATTVPGGVVVNTTTITNAGQAPYLDVSVALSVGDILDDAHYNGDGTATSGVVTFDVDTLSLIWTGNVAPGTTVTIVSSVTVNDPDTGNTVVTMVASSAATGNNCPTGSTDPRCTSSVNVLIPTLTIEKTADLASATPGDAVRFTVTVTNSGETPYDDAVVTDSLDEVLDDVNYNGDAAASTGAMSYSAPILTWTGDLAAGATATITYSITVDDPYLGDGGLRNTVTSSEPGSTCPPAGANPACTVELSVLIPSLTIGKSADTTGVTAGETVQYTISVRNTGQTAYSGITVADDLAEVLDDAGYNDDATATAGTLDLDGTTLTWTGDLALGAVVFVRYSVTVDDPDLGDHLMTNTVTSAAAGSNCPDGSPDPSCTTTVSVLTTALDIGIVADTASIVEGGTVDYTVTLTNTGQAPYIGISVINPLAGVLDDAGYNDDATASAGTLALDGTTLTWTGDLFVAEEVTITYSVTVDLPAEGDRSLVNVVTSTAPGSACPPPGTAPGCTATTTVVEQTLELTGLTPSFALASTPGSTVTEIGAVTMTLITNSLTGYQVSVQAASGELVNTTPGSTDSIPIDNLRVRETGTQTFQSLSATEPVVVHSQDEPSIPEGDVLSNDYQMIVPLTVTVGEYVGTLTYVAIAA